MAQMEARRVWDAEVGGSSPPTPTSLIKPTPAEVSVRGQRTIISKKKIDMILVAARYEPGERRLQLVQGYSRRGVVWSDRQLFSREILVQRLRDGDRLATGRVAELEGDFEVHAHVQLEGSGAGSPFLVADGLEATGDNLALPLF